MRYVLDTNVLVHAIRNSPTWQQINQQFDLLNPENQLFISFVTKVELFAIGLKNAWGEKKMQQLEQIMQQLTILGINDSLLQNYIEIDAYSNGKHPTKQLPTSSIKMGKHDIWIAATAAYIYADLITTDKDFNHLNHVFLRVHYIAPN